MLASNLGVFVVQMIVLITPVHCGGNHSSFATASSTDVKAKALKGKNLPEAKCTGGLLFPDCSWHISEPMMGLLRTPTKQASRPVLAGIVSPWDIAGGGSARGGVKKDVEGLDSAAFNLGDIGSGHSRRTVRRTGPPAQAVPYRDGRQRDQSQ